jgi:hypothetical protein
MSRLKDELGFFVTVPETLVERAAEIGTDALTLFVYLRYRTNRKRGEAWPGYERIGRDLGWGNSRISQAIHALESAGYLERRKRFGATTCYTLKHVGPPDVAGAPSSPPGAGELSDEAPPVLPGREASPPRAGEQSSQGGRPVLPGRERILDSVNPTPKPLETDQTTAAADSPAHRSKADRLAGDHQVLAIMTGLGIADGQARRLSLHFTISEAEALADVARRMEPDDLGAYAAQLFRDHLVEAT